MTVAAATKWGKEEAESRKQWEIPAGSNHTVVWDWYAKDFSAPDYQGQPWCGANLLEVLLHGGLKMPANWIGVFAIQAWAEAHGRWSKVASSAKEGDALVLLGAGVHCGYARGNAAGGIVPTDEGNTSPGSEGSQFDGGTAALRDRPYSQVYGVVKLHDLLATGKAPAPKHGVDNAPTQPQYKKEATTGNLHLWETGKRVAAMQAALGINSDGYFGTGTAKALGAYEKAHKTADTNPHIATPALLSALEKVTKPPVYPTLSYGDKGGTVRKMQRMLNKALGGEDLKDDGDYGDYTALAVENYKKAHPKSIDNTNGKIAGQEFWHAIAA